MQTPELKKYALSVLGLSQKFLEEDGDLDPTAFIVSQDEQLVRPLNLSDERSKIESCARVLAEARASNAVAIVTSFIARSAGFAPGAFDSSIYAWGQLQEQANDRSILVTLSGPGLTNWGVSSPFETSNGKVTFGKQIEYAEGLEIGLFPGWSDSVG